MATHSSMLAWKTLQTEELVGYSPQGHKESDVTKHAHPHSYTYMEISLRYIKWKI